ncbi:unnamed protein product, partial [Didymodactylos carnosus]
DVGRVGRASRQD